MKKVMMGQIVNGILDTLTKENILGFAEYDSENNWTRIAFIEFPYSFYVTKTEKHAFEFLLKKGEEGKQENVISRIFKEDEEVELEKEAWESLQNTLKTNTKQDEMMSKIHFKLPTLEHSSLQLVEKRIAKSSEEFLSADFYMIHYVFKTKKQDVFWVNWAITADNQSITVDYDGKIDDENLIATGTIVPQFQEQMLDTFHSYEWEKAHYIIEDEAKYKQQLETTKSLSFEEDLLSWYKEEVNKPHEKEENYHHAITLPNDYGKQIAHTVQKLGIGIAFIKTNEKKPEVFVSFHNSNGEREHASSFYGSFQTFLENNGLYGEIGNTWVLGLLDGTKLEKLEVQSA